MNGGHILSGDIADGQEKIETGAISPAQSVSEWAIKPRNRKNQKQLDS
jgi:hypothetical protein